MKRILNILLFVLLASSLFAQPKLHSGIFTLGGNISFSSQSFDKLSNNSTVFMFNPQAGYFFVDNFYTALSVNYEHYSFDKTSSDQVGFGPSVRYYFDFEKLKPFVGLSYQYYEQSNNGKDKITTSEIKFSGGINYFLTNSIAIEASLNYSLLNYNLPNNFYLNSTDQSKLFRLALGVNFFID